MAELNPARGARGGAELVARAGAERVVVRSFNWWSVGLWPQRFLGALFPTFSHFSVLATAPHACLLAGITVLSPYG